MFRKIISILVSAVLLSGLCGCTLVSRVGSDSGSIVPREKFKAESLHVPAPVPEEEVPEDDASASEETEAAEETIDPTAEYPQIKEDDPMYGDVSDMVRGLTPVFSYFAMKDQDLDLSSLSAEDFWMLMAMIAAEVNGDSKDADGSVSLRQEVLADYAASFFPDYFSSHGLPDWRGTASASVDPRSQVISLSAMGVDGYHGRLAGFEASPDREGLYDLYLEIYWSVIEGAQTGSGISENLFWKVALEPWPEDSEHAFAFRMTSFERLEVESPQDAAQEETAETQEVSAD